LESVQLINRNPGEDTALIETSVSTSYLPDVNATPPLVGTAIKRKVIVSGGGGIGLK
jgi:hypothetical protein